MIHWCSTVIGVAGSQPWRCVMKNLQSECSMSLSRGRQNGRKHPCHSLTRKRYVQQFGTYINIKSKARRTLSRLWPTGANSTEANSRLPSHTYDEQMSMSWRATWYCGLLRFLQLTSTAPDYHFAPTPTICSNWDSRWVHDWFMISSWLELAKVLTMCGGLKSHRIITFSQFPQWLEVWFGLLELNTSATARVILMMQSQFY